MTDTKLKSYVDRIESLETERKEIGADVRDIYSEAKGNGYNPKALRRVIAQRRQKTDEQLEAEVEAYRAALGMHGSYRKAAAALGVSKSTLHRTVPRASNGTAQVSRVAEDVDGGEGTPPQRPESKASLAGEAEAPAHIEDDLAIPAFLRSARAA